MDAAAVDDVCGGWGVGQTSPFCHAGRLDLVNDDDLLAPVDRGGEADAQAGGGALHYLHQQGARGLLHSL